MQKKILNLIIFQVGWLVCVLGGDLYAIVYTAIALVMHHAWIVERKSEWQLVAMVTAVGSLWDILMIQTGLINFVAPGLLGIPVWLICLWILFATTFLHCLSWLRQHLWIAAVAAALFAPFSYWLGAQLGGAVFGSPVLISLLVIAFGWSMLFPAGMYLSRRYQS